MYPTTFAVEANVVLRYQNKSKHSLQVCKIHLKLSK